MKRFLLLTLAAVVLAGCGSDGDGGEAAEQPAAATEQQAATTEQQAETEAATVSGEELFAANCAGCHTLEAAGATGAVGPNLDELQPSVEQVAEQVRTGGGGMPSFADQLSDAEIRAVAEFVAESAGG